MRARQKVSRAGVELIKSFEGLRQAAARLPDGRWTLGYGHTFSAREGARVTQEDADALLRFDLLPIVDALNNLVLVPMNQNQFDALVSFCFNIGVDNFGQSTVLKRINEGRMTEAAQAMDAWRSAEFNGQTYVLAPLIRRRAAEKNLFLTPDETTGHAPSLLVRPVEDAGGLMRPSELNAPDRGGILSAYPVGMTTQAPAPAPVPEPVPIYHEPIRPEPVVQAPAVVVAEPVITPEMLSPYARPAPATFGQPMEPPVEQVLESLPGGLMSPGVMRETPVVEAAPTYAPVYVAEPGEPQMSPQVQALLARAQEEQRQAQVQAQMQADALAASRAAEDARQEQVRLEQIRQEQARLEQARLEQMRLEQQRLEQARLEQARLDEARLLQERLEQERAEQARLEQARLEQERLEQARLEQARLEQARLEQARLDQERLERERLERERAEAEKAREAAAAPTPTDEEAEKIRKAEAAAALMRLYSPYGGSTIGRSLAKPAPVAPAPAPAPAPVAPTPVDVFTNQSVISPASAQSAPIIPEPEPAPKAAIEPEPEYESDIRGFTPFKPVVSPSVMPAPVITAFNPYARPAPVSEPVSEPVSVPLTGPAPEVVEVPRPEPVDLAAARELRPEPVRPEPVRVEPFKVEPVRAEPVGNWREQLHRPLPAGYQAADAAVPEQGSLLQAQASRFAPMFDDDNQPWTMDGDRIALSSDDMQEESASWGKMIVSTFWWIFISGAGLACLGVATASWWRATQDQTVLRNGFQSDYTTLSIIAAAVGIFFVSVSVWLIMKRLGGLKD